MISLDRHFRMSVLTIYTKVASEVCLLVISTIDLLSSNGTACCAFCWKPVHQIWTLCDLLLQALKSQCTVDFITLLFGDLWWWWCSYMVFNVTASSPSLKVVGLAFPQLLFILYLTTSLNGSVLRWLQRVMSCKWFTCWCLLMDLCVNALLLMCYCTSALHYFL